MKFKCGLSKKTSKDPISVIGKGISNIDILKKDVAQEVKASNCNNACLKNTKDKKYIKF